MIDEGGIIWCLASNSIHPPKKRKKKKKTRLWNKGRSTFSIELVVVHSTAGFG